MNNQQNGTPAVPPNKKSNGRIALIWSMLLVTFVVIAVVATFIIKSFQGKDSQSTFADSRTESDSSENYEEKMSKLSALKDSKEGDSIEFGNYYGNTEWIVLKREGDILTLLSKDCINQKPYNTEYEDVTWETCSLRKWLNEEYINEAFDGIEQQLIEETVIENPDNSEYGTEGGNDTKDKIFLLSLEEVEEYFLDEDSRVAEYFGDTEGCCWWWLRSPGDRSDGAADVGSDGSVYCYGDDVYYVNGAVRPAFNLNLSNLSNLELKPNLIGTNRKQRDVKEELSQIQNAAAGDEVEYGSYLGNTTWKVLKKEEGKALLLAKDAIRYAPYNNESEDITWETCSLRTWLNDTYLNCAFNEEERKQIVKTNVENEDNPEYGTEGGADTGDLVFLLSIEEAEEYFTDEDSRIAEYFGDTEGCWWWLRSPGFACDIAAYVNSDGSVSYYGLRVYNITGAVRPALWVNLDS